jgi:molecular chaperone GrpE
VTVDPMTDQHPEDDVVDMDGVEAPLTEKQVSGDDAGIDQPAAGDATTPSDDQLDEAAADAAADQVEVDVAALLDERDNYKDIALRLQADFENYRKRVTTQHGDDVARATGKLAEALLPVLDACEAAFVQHPAEVEPLFNLLLGELRKQGLEALNLHEQPFDPAVADAVLHEPGDSAEPVVSEVLRTGYTWKGKVLRPAMVKVRG